MSGFRIFMLVILLFTTTLVQCHETKTPQINTVEQFINAFNAHDTTAMANLVADDIELREVQ